MRVRKKFKPSEQQSEENNFFIIFPAELIIHVLSYLEAEHLFMFSLVSRKCLELSRDNLLWFHLFARSRNAERLIYESESSYKDLYRTTIPEIAATETSKNYDTSYFYSHLIGVDMCVCTLLKDVVTSIGLIIEFRKENFIYILQLTFKNIAEQVYLRACYLTAESIKPHCDNIKHLSFGWNVSTALLLSHLERGVINKPLQQNPADWIKDFLLKPVETEREAKKEYLDYYFRQFDALSACDYSASSDVAENDKRCLVS